MPPPMGATSANATLGEASRRWTSFGKVGDRALGGEEEGRDGAEGLAVKVQ